MRSATSPALASSPMVAWMGGDRLAAGVEDLGGPVVVDALPGLDAVLGLHVHAGPGDVLGHDLGA
jgi:hypothetical protein